MKKTFAILGILVCFAIIIGFITPALVSAKDSIAVGAGFAIVLAAIVGLIYGFKRLNITIPWHKLVVVGLLMISVTACDNVPVGNLGVLVNKTGSDKGVDQKTLSPGRYWLTWNEELFVFPTFTTTDTYEAKNKQEITFQTKEGMTVSADVGATFHFQTEAIPNLFQKFRKGAEEISDIYIRRNIQDAFNTAASTVDLETLYGVGKAKFIADIEQQVRADMKPLGIEIENIYIIGAVRVPQSVIDAINAKMSATQQAQQRQNEVASAKAEADKKIEAARGDAESIRLRAEAQAAANEKLSKSLTPSLVQYTALQKWNGELPKMTGTGAIPMISLDK